LFRQPRIHPEVATGGAPHGVLPAVLSCSLYVLPAPVTSRRERGSLVFAAVLCLLWSK